MDRREPRGQVLDGRQRQRREQRLPTEQLRPPDRFLAPFPDATERAHARSAATGRIAPVATSAPWMPNAAMSTGARTPPRAGPALATLSTTPRTATREALGAMRWMSVNPATSSTALLRPTAAMHAMATAGSTTMPMTAIGTPQPARATANGEPSRRRPVSEMAAIAPASPPRPTAALSVPTPGSPIPSSSMAATTMSTLSSPRTNVWRPRQPMTSPRSGIRIVARRPADSSASAASAPPMRSRRPTWAMRSRPMLATPIA